MDVSMPAAAEDCQQPLNAEQCEAALAHLERLQEQVSTSPERAPLRNTETC